MSIIINDYRKENKYLPDYGRVTSVEQEVFLSSASFSFSVNILLVKVRSDLNTKILHSVHSSKTEKILLAVFLWRQSSN